MVFRVYVEKKPGFAGKADALAQELRDVAGIASITGVRLVARYDVEGISEELFERCVPVVFAEPQVDAATRDMPRTAPGDAVFAVEYLPGQFDVRASSAAECVQLVSQGERPAVRTATVYVLSGGLDADDVARAKHYLINPVEAREATLELPATLRTERPEPAGVEVLAGFRDLDDDGVAAFIEERGLAMDADDLRFTQDYFRAEGRDPTIAEVRVMDTYWSDHCRHTTFGTHLTGFDFHDQRVAKEYYAYLDMRAELGREERPVTLMDIATMGARVLAARGVLTTLDESEEVNACTVRARVDVDGHDEDWLYLFKNETHNHPTEIEPFGGAATCIGGAIRDPLSGRAYVYQAMRVSGAADPRAGLDETLPGKLPQRKIVTTAAEGYSSYGNQIGLATGQVSELYHPGYVAKRMEIGAVVAATPASHVRRERPAPGDVVVLVGGRTGRDGIGGATGSSKAHDSSSLEKDGAEVQKGNPVTERKLQRLFRREDACRLIKRCNDFGAGGVSVAVGELADGLDVNLDAVPKKYEGLDGTELAISESQERMAVVLAPGDVRRFRELACAENLEATPIAVVTAEPRLRMRWRGATIVDVSREFLSSNGAPKTAEAVVRAARPYERTWEGDDLETRLGSLLADPNVASNKGLAERFDSTIGAATVLMPFGGATQLTPAQAMVAKLPVDGETTTVSGMAWGFNPYLTEADPFSGSYLAVVESVSRLVATGFRHRDLYLTFQEYFGRLRDDPERWGVPLAALLGALKAQTDLGIASVGGKDSMSGSFEGLDVPPTLVSFATGLGSVSRVVSPEFKRPRDRVLLAVPSYDEGGLLPEPSSLLATWGLVEDLVAQGCVRAAATCGYGCLAEQLFKMCVGNTLGVSVVGGFDLDALFSPAYGSFVLEVGDDARIGAVPDGVTLAVLGEVSPDFAIEACGERVSLIHHRAAWEGAMAGVFPYHGTSPEPAGTPLRPVSFDPAKHGVEPRRHTALARLARPRVAIPVFPGTNCEYDSERAWRLAGALPEELVINNLTPERVAESADALVGLIDRSQILMIPGGFSAGDEPDGSAKSIAAFFRAPAVTEAVRRLLFERDGLVLGICNGFQALVKLGLLPFGDIRPMDESCPTLTFNTIGRHQSRLVHTRVCSTLSPWLSRCEVGQVHVVPVSHGEGRFVASDELLAQLAHGGQIATQYVSEERVASMDLDVNPNGSYLCVEGITSPDGRILGKMGHSERTGAGLYQNVPGNSHEPLFEAGVDYFA